MSGPGTAIFTNPSSLNSTVQFTATGTYVLDLVSTRNVGQQCNHDRDGQSGWQRGSFASRRICGWQSNRDARLDRQLERLHNLYHGFRCDVIDGLATRGGGPGTVTFGNASNPQTTAAFSARASITCACSPPITASPTRASQRSGQPISGSTTTTLQQGVKSYTGGSSTYIDSSATTTNYSTGTFASYRRERTDDALLMFSLSGTTVTGTASAATLRVDLTSASSARSMCMP